MKRLAMVVALCAAAPVALAQTKDAGVKETPAQQLEREVGGTAKSGAHAIQDLERKVRGQDGGTAKAPPSAKELSQAFDLKGTVKSPSAAFLTVERPGLPPASLSVRDRTQVLLDGKAVDVKDLPEGAQVRAKFQLEGEEPVALRIEAKAVSAAKATSDGGTKP